MTRKETFKTYYRLTKPGIIYGNALTAIAGYFFGAAGQPLAITFFGMLIGICTVMASACVYNNVLDRDIDKKMSRTKNRALVSGAVSPQRALGFATGLLIFGIVVLLVCTNLLTLGIALFGHFAYVVLYGYAKRTTVHGTLVGTISGATPPVIGYVAATGKLDVNALLLFLILVAWQMPHFFAIAIFRRDDYASAGIPVLPVVRGLKNTRFQIVVYALLYVVSIGLLGLLGTAGLMWTLLMVLAGSYWLYLCLEPVSETLTIDKWARRQFRCSLVVLLLFSVSLSIEGFLH